MNESTIMPSFSDKRIQCVDCRDEFIFTVGEQGFFWSKGLTEPKRCPACRRFRKGTIARVDDREVR